MRRDPEGVQHLAHTAAVQVVGQLEGERLIPRFIDSYVMAFDRPQLKNPYEKFRQRSRELGREALLLLGALVVEKAARKLHRFELGPLKLADPAAAREFAEGFWQALADELKGGAEDARELNRRAEDYQNPDQKGLRFRTRVAPLLDPLPQMKEKAEHAGQKFFEALEQVSSQVVRRTFSPEEPRHRTDS
jgi:hypothetical protein